MTAAATLQQVRAFRWQAQELDRPRDSNGDCALLDFGVQNTGPDGAAWALAVRGCGKLPDTSLAWTLRGAPHLYRTTQLPAVATATAPFSEADAAKRIYSANKPLKAAGIPALTALQVVAAHMREIAAQPIVKGQMSTALTARLPAPYLHFCRPCDATHIHEMPFRLAALQAGLRLQPGTSPPVLERVPGWVPVPYAELGGRAQLDLDAVRNYLRFFGPATPKHVAGFLDSPLSDVKARWPADAAEVTVDGERRWVLAADADRLLARPEAAGQVRLLGPYDPYLQLRDRETLVREDSLRKALWPVLGRPGVIARDGDVLGTWRPRSAGAALKIRVDLWVPVEDGRELWAEIEGQARLLAAFRDQEFTGWAEK